MNIQSASTAAVVLPWQPRTTMPASVSRTTPGKRKGSGCWCAGLDRSIWSGAPPGGEVLGRAGQEPHVAVPPAGGRIDEGGGVPRLLAAGKVVDRGDPPDGLGECRMLGHIVDALTIEVDGTAVLEAGEVLGSASHRLCSPLARTLGERRCIPGAGDLTQEDRRANLL